MIRGTAPPSLGEEAVASCVSSAIERDDYITLTYKRHEPSIVKGQDEG